MKKGLTLVLTLVMAFALVSVGFAQDKAAVKTEKKHEYVGAAKCKMCHIKEYKSWEATKMAKSFSVLKPEEQKDPKCNVCHTTGKLADGTMLEGVQCESCHGAGADYKAKEVMKDMKASMAAGLVMPNEALCLTCHKKEGNPNYKPFNYAEAVKTPAAGHERFPITPAPAQK
jgi:RecJ-like exonuclease